MTEFSWFNAALLSLRAAAHLLIFLRVYSYMADPSANHRKSVGLLAGAFAGFNLAETIRILSNFSSFVNNVEPYLPGIMLMVLIFVTWSGGNIARFLPSRLLKRLP